MEAVRVVGLEIGIGRRGAEVGNIVGIVALEDHLGIVGVGVLVKALGQQDDRREIHGTSPEFCQQRTLDADMANVLGIGLGRDRTDNLVEGEVDGRRAGADVHFAGRAVEVAGGEVPVLAFATIGSELDGFAVAAMESLVNVEDSLHSVVAGRNVLERPDGITGSGVPDGDSLTRLQPVHSNAKDQLRPPRIVNLHARLGAGIVGEQEKNAAIKRTQGPRGGKADGNGLGAHDGRDGGKEQCTESNGRAHRKSIGRPEWCDHGHDRNFVFRLKLCLVERNAMVEKLGGLKRQFRTGRYKN